MRSILSMFAKSPFKPLVSHMEMVRSCVDQVQPLFTAQLKGQFDKVGEMAEKIVRLEHEADTIKSDIRNHLPQGIFLAVDRRDFLHLLSAQDDIADAVEDLAVLLRIKNLKTTEAMKGPLTELVDHVANIAQKSCDLIHELNALLEASFGGMEAEKVEKGCHKLAELEWEADRKQFQFAKTLFAQGDELSSADLLLWNEVSKKLGGVADKSEQIGKVLRIFLAK
ncbi:TIGR00153 family protein [Nitrospina gracilis]|uniref:TIGR00153 family protein n=1 Tax=Nitrospina gracilis TaxID=35801 RepID=UPI001F46AEB0|nr:TIGR00153 family protein [Nitrospina gracilis]MCF8721144.1 putative phosphate transport protein (TIGR00153 family) [Nitrospina gracilis Nb-211]